jgi:hypothetical protein
MYICKNYMRNVNVASKTRIMFFIMVDFVANLIFYIMYRKLDTTILRKLCLHSTSIFNIQDSSYHKDQVQHSKYL